MLQPVTLKKLKLNEDLQDLLELTSKKDVLFIIGDWNAKVGSQETPGVTGKFGLGIWNEAGQRPLPSRAQRLTHRRAEAQTPGLSKLLPPPSLGFSRQEHWGELPFPSPMHESENKSEQGKG